MPNDTLTLLQIPIHKIRVPQEQQIRAQVDRDGIRELADSMASIGQLQPINVSPEADGYALVAGARRLLAAQRLGWQHIAAIAETRDAAQRQLATFVENVIREDLSAVEEAYGLQKMLEGPDPDVDHLASRIGKSRSWIDSRLEILAWPPNLQAAVHARRISPAAAKHLAAIPEEKHREALIEQAATAGISARTAMLWRQQAEAEPTPGTGQQPPGSGISTQAAAYQTTARCYFCGQHHPLDQVTRLVACTPCFKQLAQVAAQRDADNTNPTHANA